MVVRMRVLRRARRWVYLIDEMVLTGYVVLKALRFVMMMVLMV